MKRRLYISQKQPFLYYAVTLTWATCFDSFLSHLQALFLRYRSLLPILKMHCGIPNAHNFCIMQLYSCMFHQFYYMDTAHSLYSLIYQQQKQFFLYLHF